MRNTLLIVLAMSLGLVSCKKALEDDFDLEKYGSNGVGSVDYFYNNTSVHKMYYGQKNDGYFRQGIVSCAYSSKYDKLSLDLFVPEDAEIGSFADASEGIFVELYDKGEPKVGTYSVTSKDKSQVHGMLPASVVKQLHHFSTNLDNSRCNIRITTANQKLAGNVDCFDLGSSSVSGKLTIRSNFECDYLK